MTDIGELTIRHKWSGLLARYSGGKLRKRDLVEALRACIGPPPDMCAAVYSMVADVIEGTGKPLQNGNTGLRWHERLYAAWLAKVVEQWIADPDKASRENREVGEDGTIPQWIRDAHKRTTYKRRKDAHKTAREQAKAYVAEEFGVSVRTVEACIAELDGLSPVDPANPDDLRSLIVAAAMPEFNKRV